MGKKKMCTQEELSDSFLFVVMRYMHVSINLIPTVDVFMLGHISSLIAHVVYSQLPSCS